MKARAQRGTVDNRPVYIIVLILIAIGWANWPGGAPDIFSPTVIQWLVGIGLVLAVICGIGAFFWARDQARMREIARGLGSELIRDQRTTFGQNTIEYWVPVKRHGWPAKARIYRSATYVLLEVAGGQPAPFRITATPGGGIAVVEGQDAARAFMDEGARSSLERMAKIGKPEGVVITVAVGPEYATVCRDGAMNAPETLLFLELSWPVLDRALAHCFGKPVQQ